MKVLAEARARTDAEVGGTPGANFRPDFQAVAAVEWLGFKPLQPLLAYRYFDYDNGDVHTVTPGLRVTPVLRGNAELRYGISHSTIDNSDTGVFNVRANLTLSETLVPYLAYYNGEESLPPQATATFRS